MKDTQWNMNPNKAKAIMLAKRELAEFVWNAVNLEGIDFKCRKSRRYWMASRWVGIR